jgi:glycosyltransferase involved in cell wall biosynthesis
VSQWSKLYDSKEIADLSMRGTRDVREKPIESVLIVCDRDPGNSPPGQARRVESLRSHFSDLAPSVDVRAVSSGASGMLRRSASALLVGLTLRSLPGRVVVVSGLGAPHMLLLATLTALRMRTFFDACDSWLMQLDVRKADNARLLPIKAGIWLMHLHTRIELVTYISERDREADRRILRAPSAVVRQSSPQELLSLARFSGPVRRVVVAADFTSFHNTEGAEIALRVLGKLAGGNSAAKFHLYGRIPDSLVVPQGIVVEGWAETLSEIYAGQTAVLVTNRFGSGVPNKVVEAIAAGRPLLLHKSLDYLDLDGADVHFFESEQQLVDIITEMTA